MQINKINDFMYEIPVSGEMNVPGRIFASEKLIETIKDDDSLKQVVNVAKLPGIIDASIAMPDIHLGYGFSIGGVAAFDLDEGVITPGGVGFDINCGVRILATNIRVTDFMEKRKEILHDINRSIPSGVGRGNKEKISLEDLNEILMKGAKWAVENGMGEKEDLKNTEEGGCIQEADPKTVSQRAKARGRPQVGTLGAGNHFLDILSIDEVLDEKNAKKMGLKKGNIAIMIHCGSRGLGHQVASDYIQEMGKVHGFPEYDPQLVHAPIKSKLGKEYMSAMNCAVNFAFCNRQIIMHRVRKVLEKFFPKYKNNLVYDVAHNIAKIEEHNIGGKKKKVCVHRKGATRAVKDEPAIIPGSMGTASYALVGGEKSEELSFASTAHGAGRVMSRSATHRDLSLDKIKESLKNKDILIEAGSKKGIVEESPEAYKNIEEVIEISTGAGLVRPVVRMLPIGVMIG
jgi:tRNA-splicing ligase RtcB (3'-phosphate/5'-hydroxy nucleic acid ligase)